jgi:undecaprenyl-diphosphatase
MTTFQAVVYAVVHGFTEFLPVSVNAHHQMIPYLFGWQAPEGAFLGALSLGAFLSALIYFRHDWASMLSSFIQMILFRRKPMTPDERLPLFLILTTIPTVAAWYQLRENPIFESVSPLLVAAGLVVFGLVLFFSDSVSRRNKGMFDWNWLDSLITGVTQALMFIPGCGRMTGLLIGAHFRNYNREAAAKYAFYAAMPILGANTVIHLRGVDLHAPGVDLSIFTFVVTIIVTMLAGMLAIGALMNNVQRKGFAGILAYRIISAIALVVVIWTRSRG